MGKIIVERQNDDLVIKINNIKYRFDINKKNKINSMSVDEFFLIVEDLFNQAGFDFDDSFIINRIGI